jgi:hypothetical protein
METNQRRGSFVFTLMSLFLAFFVSCVPRGQSPSSTPGTTPPPSSDGTPIGSSPAPTPNGDQGTVDSGGGNTLLGKPLESYKIKVRDLDAYKKIVAPIVESSAIKNKYIQKIFYHILDKKIWYLVPSELKQLSADRIGAAVGSDQAALQDFKQVWLNSLIFDKMKFEEQAVLIIHELLMGFKLLKLDNQKEYCLSSKTGSSPTDLQDCYNHGDSDKIRGKPSDLSQDDYAQIRGATALIFEENAKLTWPLWESILESHGFIEIPKTKKLNLAKLKTMLEESKLMKTWPTFGFDFGRFFAEHMETFKNAPQKMEGFELKSDQTCEYEINIEHDQFSLTLKINGQTHTFSTLWTSEFDMVLAKEYFSPFYFYTVNSPTLKIKDSTTKGDPTAFVSMRFLGSLLVNVEVRQTVCLTESCDRMGQGLDGFFLMCYTKPNIELQTK